MTNVGELNYYLDKHNLIFSRKTLLKCLLISFVKKKIFGVGRIISAHFFDANV